MATRDKTDSVESWLADLTRLAGDRGCEVVQWGASHGLPLVGFHRPAAKPDPAGRIYLSAGIHGDEPAGPLAVEDLLRRDLLDSEFAWTICPLLNPAGYRAGTRENLHGIDLNRDYLARQSVEAAAHCDWIDTLGCYDLYLSLHEDWEATGFYLYEINGSGQPPFAAKILEEVGRAMEIEPLDRIDGHPTVQRGHIAHSPEPDDLHLWPEAIYHCKRYPHLSYTFETPSRQPIRHRITAQVIATRTAANELLALKKNLRREE